MAIIIPSRNIFKIDNPKVISNVIKKINVVSNDCSIAKKYGDIVYQDEILLEGISLTNSGGYDDFITGIKWDYTSVSGNTINGVGFVINYLQCINKKLYTKTIRIYKDKGNSRITKVLSGINKDGAENISVSYLGDVETAYAYSTDFSYSIENVSGHYQFTVHKLVLPEIISSSFSTEYDVSYRLPQEMSNTNEWGSAAGGAVPESSKRRISLTTTLDVESNENIGSASFSETDDYYEITLNFVPKFETAILSYSSSVRDSNVTLGDIYPIVMQGEEKIYTPKQISISVNGDIIRLDLADDTIYIPNDNAGVPFLVENNELLQSNSVYEYNNITQNAITKMYTDTYNHYKNGKETATIKCDIASYYDESYPFPLISEKKDGIRDITNIVSFTTSQYTGSGSVRYWTFTINEPQTRDLDVTYTVKSIRYKTVLKAGQSYFRHRLGVLVVWGSASVNYVDWIIPMTFKMYDKVIPMIHSADGKEKPMSLKKDGTPKIFNVLGVKLSYNGVVRQELSLQEV